MPIERSLNFEGNQSANAPKTEFRNHLFAIGIDQYLHIPKLENAVEDAKDFIETLVTHYQFEPENLVFLDNEKATFRTIKDTLKNYAQQLGENDNLIIFFSGHGVYDKVLEQGYWIPVDADRDSSAFYISNSDLVTYLRAIKTFHTLLISDSCFSGTLFARTRDFSDRVENIPSRWGLASGRDEPVSDGGSSGNSPFTENLLYFLKHNDSPSLTISKLIQSVKEAVANNSNQTPLGSPLQDVGDKGGEFVFHRKGENKFVQETKLEKPSTDAVIFPPKNPAIQNEKTIAKPVNIVRPEISTAQPASVQIATGRDGEIIINNFTGEILSIRAFKDRFIVAEKSGWISAWRYDGKQLTRFRNSFDVIDFAIGGQKILGVDSQKEKIELLGAGGTAFQSWAVVPTLPKSDLKAVFGPGENHLVLINSKLYINGKECRFQPGENIKRFFLQSAYRNVCQNSIWIENDKPIEICDAGFFVLTENPDTTQWTFYFVTWNHIKAAKMEIPLGIINSIEDVEIKTGGPYVTFWLKNGESVGHRYDGIAKVFRGQETCLESPENGPVWRACGDYFVIGNPEGNPEGSAFRNIWLNEKDDAGKLIAFEYYSTKTESFFLALFENGNLWTGSIDFNMKPKALIYQAGITIDYCFVRNVNDSILIACSDIKGNVQLIDFQNFRDPQLLVVKFNTEPGRIIEMDISEREKLVVASSAGAITIWDLPLGMKKVWDV